MNPGRRLERLGDLPYSKVEGQILVVVGKTREVHLLNESAARIWELLQAPVTLGALVESLAEDYDLDPAAAEKEVEAAVEEMIAKGLVRAVSA